MKLLSRTFTCLFLFITLSVTVQAQNDIRSPSEFLGYELGSQWTPHHKVMDYFRHIAETSAMAEAKKYGESYEGRQLMLAFVSDTANMSRLQEIRTNNLKRTGLVEGKPSGDTTAIVWLSYNVHGNETSSSEAAMKTIYELVRADNAETKSWLQNTVVIIDPMLNPDGRERYVHWFRQTVGEALNAQVEAREHHEPWPGGRTNHYYFDLNRDWAWLTQKESRQRVSEYQKWMPHIHVDFHEQDYNSPYYFAPAAKPFHNAITDWQADFQYTIGKNNASYFDKNNWLYFTREVFDLFYPSYGDTYPTFNGAIGMTYEQAGHSMAGLGIVQAEGDTLTLDDRLTHHFTTGLSTIEVSSQYADKLVREFSDYYQTARNNPQGEYKTFVIKADNNPDKLQALFTLLDKHKITYGKAGRDHRLNGYNYASGNIEQVQVAEGDYLVSASQPKGVMARIMFEPRPELADSVTYDITAWEQHYAYGVEGYALKRQLEVEEASYLKEDMDNTFGEKPYAYLARWQDLSDVRLLADLLNNDINVRFAGEEFKIDDRMYGRGTLIITRADNKNTGGRFDRIVQNYAEKHSQHIEGVETSFVQSGADFGSSSVRYLKKPRIALLAGEGTSSNRVGEVWHFFDRQIDYPVTLLDTGYFEEVDLGNYDVLILPSAIDGDKFDDERFRELREWIKSGGKLIAVSEANNMLAGKDGFDLKWKEDKDDSTGVVSDNEKLDRYGEQQREYITGSNTGSVFEISMDTSHPLAFGYRDSYFSLKLGADAYRYLDDGWNVGVAKEDARMSGFVGHKAEEKLENTLTFGVQNMGEGSVVYMIDNPLFRAFWYNGKLLFGNAVFLVGQ
jgi:hypothetical protein